MYRTHVQPGKEDGARVQRTPRGSLIRLSGFKCHPTFVSPEVERRK